MIDLETQFDQNPKNGIFLLSASEMNDFGQSTVCDKNHWHGGGEKQL